MRKTYWVLVGVWIRHLIERVALDWMWSCIRARLVNHLTSSVPIQDSLRIWVVLPVRVTLSVSTEVWILKLWLKIILGAHQLFVYEEQGLVSLLVDTAIAFKFL